MIAARVNDTEDTAIDLVAVLLDVALLKNTKIVKGSALLGIMTVPGHLTDVDPDLHTVVIGHLQDHATMLHSTVKGHHQDQQDIRMIDMVGEITRQEMVLADFRWKTIIDLTNVRAALHAALHTFLMMGALDLSHYQDEHRHHLKEQDLQ